MGKKLVGGIGAAIVVIVIIGLKFGAGMGIGFLGAKASAPEVGECVVLSGGAESAEVETEKCGPDTLWKVAADDGECDEMETTYYVEVSGKNAVNLCLTHDVEVGECLEFATESTTTMDKQVACDATPAAGSVVVKVAKVDTTSADLKCGKKQLALPNVTRKSSMCVGDPAA